ncbi:MAG TPA: histidine phosphatase family protein [Casimicrobiaceae bacterium]|nr:histidine phosphatase family protein [Casimicrobiaceae bacterium]
MEVILWRHCDAAPGVPDESRTLTPRGLRQAEAMARRLLSRLPADCRIIASPAVRAQQTAQTLGHAFVTDQRLASGAEPEDVLAAIGWPDAGGTVLVVGHQPTLGRVASLVLDGEADDRTMRTGEALWLSSGEDDGSRAMLVRSMAPDVT